MTPAQAKIVRALAPLDGGRSNPEYAKVIVEYLHLRRLSRSHGCPCWWFKHRTKPKGHRDWLCRDLPQGFDHMTWAIDEDGCRVLITQPYQSDVTNWEERFGCDLTRMVESAYGFYSETQCLVLVQGEWFNGRKLLMCADCGRVANIKGAAVQGADGEWRCGRCHERYFLQEEKRQQQAINAATPLRGPSVMTNRLVLLKGGLN